MPRRKEQAKGGRNNNAKRYFRLDNKRECGYWKERGEATVERMGAKTRDIHFFSQKNQKMMCVHSRQARDYAKQLEEMGNVKSYETCVPLDMGRFIHVQPVDIRPDYLQKEWTTDFLLEDRDGHKSVREVVLASSLKKRAMVERLELSRRYWATMNIKDWNVVLVGIGT